MAIGIKQSVGIKVAMGCCSCIRFWVVARELQLPRKTLYDKLAKHGLRAEDYRKP